MAGAAACAPASIRPTSNVAANVLWRGKELRIIECAPRPMPLMLRQTNRQPCDGLTSGSKNGVAHCGRDRGNARLAHPSDRGTAVDDRHRDFGRFAQRQQAIRIEVALLDAAVLNGDLANERRG
jgi:hypothetical protein